MISQNDFIESLKGKNRLKEKYYVKSLRKICDIIPISFPYEKKQIKEFVFLSICRKEDFDMFKFSLYTFYKHSSYLPSKVILVSDGSWEPDEAKDYFPKSRLPLEPVKWDECSSYYNTKCPSLTSWAEKHIWGKKMAAILYFSEKYKVLFSDPDVLWFNTPLNEEEINNSKFKVTIDNSHNYDDDCIKELGYDYLYKTSEPINCGVVFIHGGLGLLSDEALKCIEYEGTHAGPFAEQTVFALMDRQYDNRWSMQQITSEISDIPNILSFRPIIHYKNMVARHYLWRLKWIYWRTVFKEIVFR